MTADTISRLSRAVFAIRGTSLWIAASTGWAPITTKAKAIASSCRSMARTSVGIILGASHWSPVPHAPTIPVGGPLFQGSGTGVIFCMSPQFPPSYRGTFLVNDWSSTTYIWRSPMGAVVHRFLRYVVWLEGEWQTTLLCGELKRDDRLVAGVPVVEFHLCPEVTTRLSSHQRLWACTS